MSPMFNFLNANDTSTVIVHAAIVITHACAGAGWILVALPDDALTRDARRQAARTLLVFALALALPVVAAAALALVSSSRETVRMVREALGPADFALAASPAAWFVAWAIHVGARSASIGRAAGHAAAAVAALGVFLGAAVAALLWNPARWIESRALRDVMLSGWVIPILVARVATALTMGGASAWAWMAPGLDGAGSRRIVVGTVASAIVSAAAMATTWGGAVSRAASDAWLEVPTRLGVHAEQAGRLTFVAALLAALAALLLLAARRHPVERLAPAGALALCCAALFCLERARHAAVLPWSVPGVVFANGTQMERVRLARRSARLETASGVSDDAIGAAMFSVQCRACHAPIELRAKLGDRGFPATRAFLEGLREADQVGSAWRGVMPPLVGSDREVESLSRWASSPR